MKIIVKYDPYGRMGNRLFQYAFGLILSKLKNVELYQPELPNFNIIPMIEDSLRPEIFSKMIKSIQKMKALYKNWLDLFKAKTNLKIENTRNSSLIKQKKDSRIKYLEEKIKNYEVSYIKGCQSMNSKQIYNLYLKSPQFYNAQSFS